MDFFGTPDITDILYRYEYPAIFLLSFIFGQGTIFTILFLSAQGWLRLEIVFLLVLGGNMMAGIFWYTCGALSPRILHLRNISKTAQKHLHRFLEDHSAKKLFYALFLANFLYGFRFLVYVLLGTDKVRLFRFLWLNFLGSLSWLIVFTGLAFAAKSLFSDALAAYHTLQGIFLTLFFSYLLFKSLDVIIRKKFKIGPLSHKPGLK
jgi:membrane protein DedA with SNARE-associated domain